MTTLNYNWQLIAEAGGSLNGNTCNVRIYAKINSQSMANNNSSVSYQSRLYYSNSYGFSSYDPTTKSISGTGAGSQSANAYGTYGGGETVLQTITGVVGHNASGNANVSMSANFNAGPWGYNVTASGSVALPQIKRLATVTNAPNFNDEDNNIQVSFNNPANFEVVPYMDFFLNDGTSLGRIQREKAKYTSPYTWIFTQEEINTLRTYFASSNSGQVNIGFFTYNGNTYLGYNFIKKTFSIVNANPIFTNFDYNDINTTTLALTGNSKYNINGYSTIRVLISSLNKAEAQKGASMVKYQFMIGDTTKEVAYSDSSSVYIDIPNASVGEYKVYAIDSRNNSTLVTKLALRNINYEPIYIDRGNSNAERDDGGIGENVTLNYRGTIWNDSFGQVSNAITVSKYEFKKVSDSEWITGTTNITPTISENSLSFSGLVRSNETGYKFPIQESYNFRITLQDKLSETTVELTPLPSGTPNISLNRNGVGIMCDYDESLGGLLQVGGEVFEHTKTVVDYIIPSAVHSVSLDIPDSKETDIYEMYLLGSVSSSSNQDVYVQFNDITSGSYNTCMMLQSTTATADANLSGSNIFRANKVAFYAGSSLAHNVSTTKYEFFISNNKILCNWHLNIFGDGSTTKGVGEGSGYINSYQTKINKVTLTANINDSNQKFNAGTRIVIFKK